jgi:hypothetical protein
VALVIKAPKLTDEVLAKAIKAIGEPGARGKGERPASFKGRLAPAALGRGVGAQGAKAGLKLFETCARRHNVSFSVKKDASKTPASWMVFLKGESGSLSAALKDFSSSRARGGAKPSILSAIGKGAAIAGLAGKQKERQKARPPKGIGL